MQYLDELMKLDYKDIFKYFSEISAIPRGSGNEKAVSDYIKAFAEAQGLVADQDANNNLIICVPASKGYLGKPAIVLQGHMDMVCVKEPSSTHDFEKDGLELFVENGMLGAKGTSLGGDDGIAVAYMMALMADKTAAHPALELVITTEEETGLTGAETLDTSKLSGRMMINMDSEEEGLVTCACAGGMRVDGCLRTERSEITGTGLHVEVRGLFGGHSGTDIDKNKSNAIRVLARLLSSAKGKLVIDRIDGGSKDNAIPSFAKADIICTGSDTEAVLKAYADILIDELKGSEPGIVIDIENKGNISAATISAKNTSDILYALSNVMNGVQHMSAEIPGLPESSLNLGVLRTDADCVHIRHSLRSSRNSYKKYMSEQLTEFYGRLGALVDCGSEYSAWEYRRESELRKIFAATCRRVNGTEPQFISIHAGLECGIIGEKVPDMDMISIGPEMHDIHSEQERLGIESSIRVYKLVEELLKDM